MINKEPVTDEQIKDILVYINGMRHKELIRMMFFCSLNGMRSINFRSLQVKDVYNPDGSVKKIIDLSNEKNKGKFPAQYYVNNQFEKELKNYYTYLKTKWGDKFTAETYLFTSQKLNRPFHRVSICNIFHDLFHKFYIKGSSHMGRHIYITRLIDNGINPFIVQKLVNHRQINTTNLYYQTNTTKLQCAAETVKF